MIGLSLTYTIMIKGLCKEGLFEEALALLSESEDNGCLPNIVTFETVIRALFEKDENDMAEKLLWEMIARGLLNGLKKHWHSCQKWKTMIKQRNFVVKRYLEAYCKEKMTS
ncbi:hypothetical protein Ahy_A05g022831 isoform A [Arachis hypogaea]|uniref:Pentatricopeptide repeat-containing protein n=1 Tax=Arachis hypogaea TaxID=3818 RepID=A0A445D1Q0_ARAHY|nr:hypothetical protein Ahy_A05g022831 isoform A [Arachis hypogaea]